jgi:hypothetical protein
MCGNPCVRGQVFDLYRHVPRDMSEPTVSGGLMSIISIVICFGLFVAEIFSFAHIEIESSMFVDTPDAATMFYGGSSTVRININVSMPKLPCASTCAIA